jgi:ATP-binding cassette subfamily B protein
MVILYRKLLPYFRAYWKGLMGALGLAGLAIAVNLAKPWPLKVVVDGMLEAHPRAGGLESWPIGLFADHPGWLLAVLCLGMLMLYGIASGLDALSTYLLVKIGLRVLARLRADVYRHLQRLSLHFYAERGQGDLLYVLGTNVYAVQTLFNQGVIPVLVATVTLLGLSVVLFSIDRWLALIAFTIMPLHPVVTAYYAHRIQERSSTFYRSEAHVSALAERCLRGVRLIQAFTREPVESSRFAQAAQATCGANLQLSLTQLQSSLVVGAIAASGMAAAAYVGASHVLAGHLSLGELLVFLAYIPMVYGPLEHLSHITWSLAGAAPAARRVVDLLEVPEAVSDRPGALAPTSWRGRIEFREVSFAYEPGNPVLQDVTFSVNPGERVGVVGVSGVGKTALLNLLLRFDEPTAGQIFVDGIEIRDLALRSLREHISVVFQENPLLPGTVADNIAYGCPETSRPEVIGAAQAAQAHDFISWLPQCYDTWVGPGGVTLSGGECQRLAIARAFLKNAPILVLDEPTSALDLKTEAEILQSLDRLMRGRTTLLIAHRPTLLRGITRVLALEGGRISQVTVGPKLSHDRSVD